MVTIGAIGHRYLKETTKIIKGVDKALETIKEKFGTPFIMLSALAEGADRLIVHRAQTMQEDTHLLALLPLPMEDYMADFETLTSKADFLNLLQTADEVYEPEDKPSRDLAYMKIGAKIVDHSEVLLTIWDGNPPQGEGGTGEIVAYARQQGVPIAWVHAGNREPGTNQPTSLGEMQGQVSFEGFSPPDDSE